ncbi:50S ribosomal protein L2 (apicoplast) [Babesia caballi]|uniref:50S ribosomal protein L2 n=1 Tax=Babesia caballi TaxID=5871 RepID=A0AAV4M1U1_BABCB|nr:50S ribosomal protein L2 [Babesia caballi]
MIIFKISYNKKIGKSNKGRIIVRHKKSGYNNNYIPIDNNYFNRINEENLYFILYNTSSNILFRNTKIILSLCVKGSIKGEYRYILKPHNKTYGNFIKFYNKSIKTEGDVDILFNFFIGNKIYNIDYNKYTSSKICSSAMSYSTLVYKSVEYVTLKLPSNELKYLNSNHCASYYFADKVNFNKKNAGHNILLGIRPKVRGSAMNACDHPHGGGEGKAPIGKKTIYSFTGRKCKGIKTVLK